MGNINVLYKPVAEYRLRVRIADVLDAHIKKLKETKKLNLSVKCKACGVWAPADASCCDESDIYRDMEANTFYDERGY